MTTVELVIDNPSDAMFVADLYAGFTRRRPEQHQGRVVIPLTDLGWFLVELDRWNIEVADARGSPA